MKHEKREGFGSPLWFILLMVGEGLTSPDFSIHATQVCVHLLFCNISRYEHTACGRVRKGMCDSAAVANHVQAFVFAL